MGRGIQGDETPDAVVTLDDVDAGIVLFDLPEVAHRKPQQVAEDRFVDCVVRADEDSLTIIASGIFIEGFTGAFSDVFEIFPLGHLHAFRVGVPEVKFFRIARFDFFSVDAFPQAVADLREARVFGDGKVMVVRSEAAGVVRAGEGRGDRAVDMDVLEGERGRFSLLYAAGRKRRVFLSLVAAFDIPRSLSVAKKNDTDHERVSFLGVQGSRFKVQGSGFKVKVQGCGGGFAANIYGAMPEGDISVTSHQ